MTKRTTLATALLFAGALFLSGCVEKAPPKFSAPTPMPQKGPDVSMDDAKVNIHFSKFGKYVKADVRAVFAMRRLYGNPFNKTTDAEWMSFPLYYQNGLSVPFTQAFSIAVDGKKVDPLSANAPRPNVWDTLDDQGRHRKQTGYFWMTPIAKGQTRLINVNYSILIPYEKVDEKAAIAHKSNGKIASKPKAQFTYFLRSGASWSGPLWRETVHVVAGKGLKMKVESPNDIKAKIEKPQKIVWDLKMADPKEDIRIDILPDAK